MSSCSNVAFIMRIPGPDGVSFGRTAKVWSAVQGQVALCGATVPAAGSAVLLHFQNLLLERERRCKNSPGNGVGVNGDTGYRGWTRCSVFNFLFFVKSAAHFVRKRCVLKELQTEELKFLPQHSSGCTTSYEYSGVFFFHGSIFFQCFQSSSCSCSVAYQADWRMCAKTQPEACRLLPRWPVSSCGARSRLLCHSRDCQSWEFCTWLVERYMLSST